MFKHFKKLWLALIAFIILCPLGLIATGTAFGEWGADELQGQLGFVPAGLERFADAWSHAPMPDYSIAGVESTAGAISGYILSAIIGVALVMIIMTVIGKVAKE